MADPEGTLPAADPEGIKTEDGSKEVAHESSAPAPIPSVFLEPADFAEDLELSLGRANGNVYQRKLGVEGVHDGQIMVRLKKKRFIVIDYGVVPTAADIQIAAEANHIATPSGAGKQKCITPTCNKVGIPVLLFDSDPNEPPSLYMRSGLCFTCQRILNEKRRTQRKRKSDVVNANAPKDAVDGAKRFKVNGEIMELSPNAIVINGPLEGTKPQSEEYGFHEIGLDLQKIVNEAAKDTDGLAKAVTQIVASTTAAASREQTTTQPPTADESSEAFAAAAATAAAVAAETQTMTDDSVASAANAAVAAASDLMDVATDDEGKKEHGPETPPPPVLSGEDILALYEKAFLSLSKGIFLLSQWRVSWDNALAAASNANKVEGPDETLPIADDPAVADAVATAAAAAAAEGQEHSSPAMIPLILAAGQKEEENGEVIKAEKPQGEGEATGGAGAVGAEAVGDEAVEDEVLGDEAVGAAVVGAEAVGQDAEKARAPQENVEVFTV